MGFKTLKDGQTFLENETNTPRKALDRADEAERLARRREFIKQRKKEIVEDWHAAKKRRDECAKKLPAAEVAYWQALRDYTATYSHYSLYLIEDRKQWTESKRGQLVRDALTAIDAQIISQGLAVDGGTVKLITVDECDGSETLTTVRR